MKKILLIEDDPGFRENIAEILQLSNYQVIVADNGKNGIEKSLKEKPDLIVCDVVMPGLDGYGVIHVLSRHPDTYNIPFIFLTGKTGDEDFKKALGMGADAYLIKPFNEAELLNIIEVRLRKAEILKRKGPYSETGISSLFQEINNSDDLNLVSTDRDIRIYKKKHLLYSAGERPTTVYFVNRGKVKEYMINDQGKELITNIYCKGDFFGYSAILEQFDYTETVQVLEDAELMLIPKVDFIQLIYNNHDVARKFILLLSQNVHQKTERLINMAYNSLRKKVATGIIDVIDKFKDQRNGKPIIQISREDLANFVGSAQESMIRTLKDFKTEKLIEISDGDILVLNEQKLRALT